MLGGPRIAHIKVLQALESARDLRARILDHLAREAQPELDGVAIARGPADLDSRMPKFVTAFLNRVESRA